MAYVLVLQWTPGWKAALNALRCQQSGACEMPRTEFARIPFVSATCKLLMSHQEVVQSLAGQPRSGNCPRSLCRTLLRTSLASAPFQIALTAVTSGRAPGALWGGDGARVCAPGCRTKIRRRL